MILVHVEWVDSTTDCENPWQDRREAVEAVSKEGFYPGSMRNRTVGFLMHEDENVIVLTMSYNENEVGPFVAIPKVNILRGWPTAVDLPPF